MSYFVHTQNGENGREDMDECGDASREMLLRRNMEEYQNKLAQLQEHQASLADMQMCVRERLDKARQAQQMLLQQENQSSPNSTTWEDNCASLPSPGNVEQLESETATLRGKLAQLQTKKKQMDHLVAELQAIEASDRGSCVSFNFLFYTQYKFTKYTLRKYEIYSTIVFCKRIVISYPRLSFTMLITTNCAPL